MTDTKRVSDALLDRIETALERHLYMHAPKRIPADKTDSDMVLFDLRAERALPDDATALVAEQAEDEGLWFLAETAPEAHLQYALRRLHAAVDGSPIQCRSDGRCQYAIDHGAEGLGHCPRGKCAMPVTLKRAEDMEPGDLGLSHWPC